MPTPAEETWPAGHPRPPAWLGDLIIAVLMVISAFAPALSSRYELASLPVLAIMLLPAFYLPLRRRWPIPVLAVSVALFVAVAVVGVVSPGLVLASAIAMFGVATRSSRRATAITALITVLAMIALGFVISVGDAFDPRTFQFAITIAFASAAGDATRSRRAYIAAIQERARRAEQTRESEATRRVTEERLRIARDLHDVVAHQISVISLNAGVASSALDARPEKAREALASIRVASRAVLSEIGDLLEVLRSGDGASAGAVAAPQPGLARLHELVESFIQSGLNVVVRIDGDARELPAATDIVAYRVIQEALTNAHKHGGEARAHILVDSQPDAVRIVVTNPLRDVPTEPEASGGHGLIGLRERVASVRGEVQTGVTPGGFRVAATLPLSREVSA